MSAAIDLRAASLSPAARSRASEALALLGRGFSLVPMLPRTKDPHYPLIRATLGSPAWTPLKARAASAAEVLSWFEQDAEVGIAAILPNDMAAVDIDHPELWSGLPLPPTLAHVSSYSEDGRPRTHLLYRVDRPVATTRHAFGEVLGVGHLVIMPPSTHPSGEPYAWLPGLGPGEVDIAPAPDWVYGEDGARVLDACSDAGAALETLGTEPSEPGIRVRKNTLPYPDGRRNSSGAIDWPFRDLAMQEDVAAGILQAAGIEPKPLGKAFRCPLPGHGEHRPSAALWREEGKPIALHDFHAKGGTEWWPLPDVFAALKTGASRSLNKAERETWWLRGLYEAGFIEPPAMHAVKVDPDAPPAAKKLYDGFALLLGLRTFHDASQTAAPYAWDFARGWCGILSKSEVQRGMNWLLKRRYLVIVKRGSGRHASLLALGRPEPRP